VELGRAVQVELVLGNVEDGVVEHGERRKASDRLPILLVRKSTSRESMPSASSMACMSEALSLQSPNRRVSTVSTGYGLKLWMPNSSATYRVRDTT